MLTINGKPITILTFSTAAAELTQTWKPVPAGSAMVLVKTIIITAVNVKDEQFTEKHVTAAYQTLLVQAQSRAKAKDQAYVQGIQVFKSDANQQALKEVGTAYTNLQSKLQSLEDGDQVAIFRGMDPLQTMDVLANKTFSGAPAAAQQQGAPTDQDAGRQSGFAIKSTAAGRIEEWSLAPQTGFATGGFMLLAIAHPAKVNLPKKGSARLEGERGVVGYADHSLEKVAIHDVGRELTLTERESLEVDAVNKRAATDPSAILAALRAAS